MFKLWHFFFDFSSFGCVVLERFFPRVWNFHYPEQAEKTWFLNMVNFHCFFLGCGIIFFHFFSFWTWKILNFLMPEPNKFLGCRIKNRAALRIFSNVNTIIKTDAPKQSNIQQTPAPNHNSNNNWPNQIKTMEQQKHTHTTHQETTATSGRHTACTPRWTNKRKKPLCKNSSFMIIVLVTGVCVPVFVFGAWVFGL